MCVADSDHSENAGVGSVTVHQCSVAIAPPYEFIDAPTSSGEIPRGRHDWRTIAGMAAQPESGAQVTATTTPFAAPGVRCQLLECPTNPLCLVSISIPSTVKQK